jgi:hypothetical protein
MYAAAPAIDSPSRKKDQPSGERGLDSTVWRPTVSAAIPQRSPPRYERRSLLITAIQPFGEWGKIFTDKTMTLAAIDRLVHATILDMVRQSG